MAVPTWAVGQVLTASDVNTWFVPLAAYKTADTSRPTQTVVTSDPDLTVPVAASAAYLVTAHLLYEGGSQGSSDFQWQFTVPGGSTFTVTPSYKDATGANITGGDQGAGFPLIAGTLNAGNKRSVQARGTLITAATSGSLTVQWAQGSSNSTATVLHAGSSLVLTRIG